MAIKTAPDGTSYWANDDGSTFGTGANSFQRDMAAGGNVPTSLDPWLKQYGWQQGSGDAQPFYQNGLDPHNWQYGQNLIDSQVKGQMGAPAPTGYAAPTPEQLDAVKKYGAQAAGTIEGGGTGMGGFFNNYGVQLAMAAVGGLAAAGAGAGAGAAEGGAGAGSFAGDIGATDLGGYGLSGTGGATGATGGQMFDLMDPSSWGDFADVLGGDQPFTASPVGGGLPGGSDIYGNYDMGSGASGTDPFTGGNAGQSYLDQLKNYLTGGNSPPGASNLAKLLLGSAGGGTGGGILNAIPGLLGALGANSTANSQSALAQKYLDMGAPYRQNLLNSMQPGFDPTSIAGYSGALKSASDQQMASLSATGGNPFGNPGGLIDAQKKIVAGTALPAIQQYQQLNANAGGLSNFNAAAPAAQQAAINSGQNVLTNLGGAAADVFNPQQTSLASLLKSLGGGGLNLSSGLL